MRRSKKTTRSRSRLIGTGMGMTTTMDGGDHAMGTIMHGHDHVACTAIKGYDHDHDHAHDHEHGHECRHGRIMAESHDHDHMHVPPTAPRSNRRQRPWAQVRELTALLQLASPALPIGAFSYSQDWKRPSTAG